MHSPRNFESHESPDYLKSSSNNSKNNALLNSKNMKTETNDSGKIKRNLNFNKGKSYEAPTYFISKEKKFLFWRNKKKEKKILFWRKKQKKKK